MPESAARRNVVWPRNSNSAILLLAVFLWSSVLYAGVHPVTALASNNSETLCSVNECLMLNGTTCDRTSNADCPVCLRYQNNLDLYYCTIVTRSTKECPANYTSCSSESASASEVESDGEIASEATTLPTSSSTSTPNTATEVLSTGGTSSTSSDTTNRGGMSLWTIITIATVGGAALGFIGAVISNRVQRTRNRSRRAKSSQSDFDSPVAMLATPDASIHVYKPDMGRAVGGGGGAKANYHQQHRRDSTGTNRSKSGNAGSFLNTNNCTSTVGTNDPTLLNTMLVIKAEQERSEESELSTQQLVKWKKNFILEL